MIVTTNLPFGEEPRCSPTLGWPRPSLTGSPPSAHHRHRHRVLAVTSRHHAPQSALASMFGQNMDRPRPHRRLCCADGGPSLGVHDDSSGRLVPLEQGGVKRRLKKRRLARRGPPGSLDRQLCSVRPQERAAGVTAAGWDGPSAYAAHAKPSRWGDAERRRRATRSRLPSGRRSPPPMCTGRL